MRFVFSYTQPMAYSELRDAAGRLVGLAVPGETVREFAAAPDHMWTEVTADGEGGGQQDEDGQGEDPGTGQDAADETPGEDATPETEPGE